MNPFNHVMTEISMVGKAEEQLTSEGIPYEVGIAHFNELAKGQVRLNSSHHICLTMLLLLQAGQYIITHIAEY